MSDVDDYEDEDNLEGDDNDDDFEEEDELGGDDIEEDIFWFRQ